MNEATIYAVGIALIGLLGGAFGSKLLDRWFDRSGAIAAAQTRAQDEARGAQFADNEHARRWYSKELDERDVEIRAMRDHERELMTQVADLAARLARQEERANAQAVQIEEMRAQIGRWNEDYDDIKKERDDYRTRCHELANQLTPLTLKAQMAEREVTARNQEIDRLKGQLAALAHREAT